MKTRKQSRLAIIKDANRLLKDSLTNCAICPRRCGVDRTRGRVGYCRAPSNPVVYSYSAHHGEEPPLSGTRGSGAIFFSHCNMKCVYCQNYYFSQLDAGAEMSVSDLAGIMLRLQDAGCHNINLVSPTHFVPQIVASLETAFEKGLDLPIVYNTSGYDLPETLRLLKGIIDIYMPDMRYSDNETAKRYSDAPNYVEFNRASVKEMQSQAGDLALDTNGIGKRGLIIRLLVLPEDISGTKQSLRFIRHEISRSAHLSVMSQYYPTFQSYNHSQLSRGITRSEYKNIVDEVSLLGLNNGWVQERPNEPDPRFLGTNIPPR